MIFTAQLADLGHLIFEAEELCDRLAIVHRGELLACGTLQELRDFSGATRSRLEEVFFRLTEEEPD